MITEIETRFFGTVVSTNEEARKLVGQIAHPVMCLGSEQTGGIGRRGRQWASPKGNLYASLLMPCHDSPQQKALRSFTAALALSDTLLEFKPDCPVSLKWPNDVLVGNQKVAGILLEALPKYLIIGIGVNVAVAPPATLVETRALPPAALNALGFHVTVPDLAKRLTKHFCERENSFIEFGFAPLREAWLSRAAHLGEKIVARFARSEISGVFDTVDSAGALVLKTSTGPQHITAADIFFEDG
ncbi:MAG: biotin--[acetyl-CoA-carboxylase] ligase [Pseudomonadota bacterium]